METKRNRSGLTLNEVETFVFFFCVSQLTNPKDRFETLCNVIADISAAPFTSKVGSSGEVCYYREFDVVLLVGLTELKAQIRWYDNKTVRNHE
jgi:hypothetical protein